MKSIYIMALLTSLTSNAQDKETLQQSISKVAPNIEIVNVKETPIDGLSEIVVSNGTAKTVYYMSNDGKYFVNGQIVDIETRRDLTDSTKSKIRTEALSKVSDDSRINFFPEDMKYKVTVFTDVDCGYCRKLHMDMQAYNDLGIGISYVSYPRTGLNSPSYNKAVTVWCSEDQRQAMTEAQNGFEMEPKSCDNPVEDHFKAGISVGVNGTPNIITEAGDLIPTYLPPQALLERLKALEASKP